MSIKEKIMRMAPNTVLLTNPTQGFEKKVSAEESGTIKRLMQEAKITKAKMMSPMVDAFLVAADGRVTTTKISMDVAPTLKAYDVTIVKADGVSFLHYKLVEKYNGSVSLKDMLKDNSFKAEYNKSK